MKPTNDVAGVGDRRVTFQAHVRSLGVIIVIYVFFNKSVAMTFINRNYVI